MLTQPVPPAFTVSASRTCFAASLVSYASEQGAPNTDKCESVVAQCWQMGFYNIGTVFLHILGDPRGEGSWPDIQLDKDGEQDRTCSVAQFSACMYYTFLVSPVLSAHVLRSVLEKILFCLNKLNLTALMLQQIIPWVGSSFALLGMCRGRLRLQPICKLVKATVLVIPEGRT